MKKGPPNVEFSECGSRKHGINSRHLNDNKSRSKSMRIMGSPPDFNSKLINWRDDAEINNNSNEPMPLMPPSQLYRNHNNAVKQVTPMSPRSKSPFKIVRDKIVRSLSLKDKRSKQSNVVLNTEEKEKIGNNVALNTEEKEQFGSSSNARLMIYNSHLNISNEVNESVLPSNGHTQDGMAPVRSIDTDSYNEKQCKSKLEEHTSDLEERASKLENHASLLNMRHHSGSKGSMGEYLMHNCESSDGLDISKVDFTKRCVEERRDLALQLASEIRARLSERARLDEALRSAKAEVDGKLKLLQEENEVKCQERMQEIVSEWSMKLEALMSKNMKTRERLDRIVQEKIELHKEISMLRSKKNELVEKVNDCENTIKALKMPKVGIIGSRTVEEEEESIGMAIRNQYRERESELLEKQRDLDKVCKEQDKTIQCLRLALGEQAKCQQSELINENIMTRMQMEILRLVGIEQTLRQEVEAYKKEALVAREENSRLMERLGSMASDNQRIPLGYCVASGDSEDHVKMLYCRENEEFEKLRNEIRGLEQDREKLQEEANNLHSAFTSTNRTIKDLESQLLDKDKETQNLYRELTTTRDQRDALKKDIDLWSKEAIRLQVQVNQLSKRVEILDDDVMLKDGQLSILRGVLQSSGD